MINLSVCIHKGYSAVVILKDGKLIFKDVNKVKQDEITHYTEQYLNLFSKSLFLLKTVCEQERIFNEEDCIMEIRCKQVVNWFKTLNAPKNYSGKFLEALKALDMLPFRYMIINEKNPTALYYADPKYIEKEVYSTVTDLW